jgi:hypothetical protein
MRFESRITTLCAQAVAADDEKEVCRILTELRSVLHRHIEQLRNGLLFAYTKAIVSTSSDDFSQSDNVNPEPVAVNDDSDKPDPRTWQQVVHELACEENHATALQLSEELGGILQRSASS